MAQEWIDRLAKEMGEHRLTYRGVRENYRRIIRDFDAIARAEVKKPRVGVVGEIYVK